MNIFFCRTPFIIDVNAGAIPIATKVELFIWNLGEAEPTTPTHTIEKPIFSPTQFICEYNISPFVSDAITPANRVVNCKVKTYYRLWAAWFYNETFDYVSSYGYALNASIVISPSHTLIGEYDKRYLRPSFFASEPYLIPKFDVVFDFDFSTTLRVVYTSSLGSETIDYIGTGIEVVEVPLTIDNPFFVDSNEMQLQYFDGTDYIPYETYNIESVCEPKFTPYVVSFINSRGGFSYLTFFKKSTISNEFKGSDYNLLGAKQSFNVNGAQNIKLNTGWCDENIKQVIKELLLSEYVYLISADTITSGQAIIKTSSFTEKTNLNDKVINYEIEFEFSTPLIQNYV